jgi:hypothetical protein
MTEPHYREQLSGSIPRQEYPPHAPERWRTADGFECEENTNGSRAQCAVKLLKGVWLSHLTQPSDYADFICHVLHLAHSGGHDPFDIYTNAIDNFDAEAGEMEGYPVPEEP